MTGKRKQRKICDWVLSAVIAAAVWGLMVTGLFCMGIYRTDRLNEWISESSYLEERYAAFEQKVRETLAEAELPEDLLEGEEFHDRFLTDLKKQILGNASQTPETWFGNLAEERIGEYLLDLNVYTTELSDEGLFALANNLQSIERVYTEIPEIGTWREWQVPGAGVRNYSAGSPGSGCGDPAPKIAGSGHRRNRRTGRIHPVGSVCGCLSDPERFLRE